MVPSNIIQRVFSLRTESDTGTGFTIEVDHRQYLITAKHVISPHPSLTSIDIFHDDKWVAIPCQSIPVEPSTVDIAVLALSQQISPEFQVTLGMKDAYLSQSVFFVGFPFGLSFDGKSINSGFPIPLAKHGIIASLSNGIGEPLIIDAIGNPGFSGGPVVTTENVNNPKIIGVVSGYQAVQQPVFHQGQESHDLTVNSNTGLLLAFAIDYAETAIKKHPIGYRLP